jgi:Zn-dependent membrane protease YugP
MVVYLLGIGLVLAALLLPQLWVRRVLAHYNRQAEENFPGTGGELARHLLDRFGLQAVGVEPTEAGDHYDPMARKVRLTEDKLSGRTLTAITVAAHECGHALQHAATEPLFMWRTKLAIAAVWATRIGSLLLFAAPFIAVITRAPSPGLISLLGGFLVMGFGVVVQLITLPVEIDASFRKALPLLESGYLDDDQVPAARRILRAAAWTYVAGSLAGLLNFWRWLAVLRR